MQAMIHSLRPSLPGPVKRVWDHLYVMGAISAAVGSAAVYKLKDFVHPRSEAVPESPSVDEIRKGADYAAAVPDRASQLQRMQTETFDVLVIGGGATGSGTALEAASRGLKVAMVEVGDF